MASIPNPADFEKLGAFYLGRTLDASGAPSGPPLLYDARDLTTHAVCVGMTGSGKTGLCLSLLEEAAIDGIPAICIDPKGDLGNLLLTFPSLAASDFEPWIDAGDASRRGRTVPERAAEVATQWKEGLAAWGQDGARIAKLRETVDLAIYTPGGSAGRPLAVVKSLDAPTAADGSPADAETLREKVDAAVSSLLALAGVEADPLQSREHVYLANLLHHAWGQGRSMDLPGLVRAILEPPIARVGVLDLESFFPAKDRQALALRLNALLASPGFATWLEGEPLDVQRLLYTPEGKPRVVILSIAHLSESERMFFVTLLLGEVLGWMRTQPGTTSLRALLYMDEVFGFLPPVREPPSKRLFLTLLKQARAFGLGLVLATQNPIDVDYKALSNCGTWFLGRLQTERDVDRVLDGLAGAAETAGKPLDVSALRATLAGLPGRTFLMNDVHEDAPLLFHTRWALSYLRGPLAREQIRALTAKSAKASTVASTVSGGTTAAASAISPSATERPVLGVEMEELFLGEPVGDFLYHPALFASTQLHYVHAKASVDAWFDRVLLAPLVDGTPADLWSGAHVVDPRQLVTRAEPLAPKGWLGIPRGALTASRLKSVQSALKTHLFQTAPMTIGHCPDLKAWSQVGESYDQFVARVRQGGRELRDRETAKLREKWGKKLDKARQDVRKAEERVAREKGQARNAQLDTALGVGTTVLGAIFGRGTVSGHASRAATAARKASRASQQGSDVQRAEAQLAEAQEALTEVETEMAAEIRALQEADVAPTIESVSVAPRKSDVQIARFAFAWVPVAPT
ncbi:MAG: ATP-binding protein [Sandaracinus sp.]|nr:ATP-binding protein [Sandaracinus sp.]